MRLAITLAASAVVILVASTPAKAIAGGADNDERDAAVAAPGGVEAPECLISNERTRFGARSLQAAIDAAAEGDTLVVKGTCIGTATVVRDVVLKGVSNQRFGVATLDGDGSAAALLTATIAVCCESPDIRISDLTLTDGAGPGILLGGHTGATLELNRVAMSDLSAGVDGAAPGWRATVTESRFDNSGRAITGSRINAALLRSTVRNSKEYGAGCGRCLLNVVESQITSNTAGGLIVGNFGAVAVTDSTMSDNTGPGLTVLDGDALVVRSTISANSTDEGGGGIVVGANAGATVRDSTIAKNTAALDGGGVWAYGHLSIADSTVTENVAGRYGGGVYAAVGTFSLADSTVTANVASSGGGLYFDDPSGVSFLGTNTIAHNVPDDCVGSPSC